MVAAERLLAELEVATRVAGAATDAKTARDVRRYLRELEDQIRSAPAASATVLI